MNLNVLIKNNRGTALLTALLVMGVLIAVSLALSVLILREGSIVKATLDGGKAYYAAESGIEIALYKLQNGLPQTIAANFKLGEGTGGRYKLKNTCKAYPCFDEDEYDLGFNGPGVTAVPLTTYYDVLDLNESIMLPLFVVGDADLDGVLEEVPVGDFTVEFYGAFKWEDFRGGLRNDATEDFRFLSSWDVLRWKIFGLNEVNGKTESISDFTAISEMSQKDVQDGPEGLDYIATATFPSWFGSVDCDEGEGERYSSGEGGINCSPYGQPATETLNLGDQEAGVFASVCFNTDAREVYVYSKDGSEVVSVDECYEIKEFLKRKEVKLKYLSLTNLMNPSVFEQDMGSPNYLNEKQRVDKSRIFFRVELFADGDGTGNETVREFADITASGESGDSKQSINVKMQRGSFMPVFHFSLYSTYKEGADGWDKFYKAEESGEL